MKRFLQIFGMMVFAIATCASFSSCSKDDDEPKDNTEATPSTPDKPGEDKPTVSKGKLAGTKWEGEYFGDKVTLEFLNNGTMSEVWDGMTSETKYEESDNKLIFEEGCVLYNIMGESCEFSISGSKLKLDSAAATFTLTKIS